MKISCQSCDARYTIADEKIQGKLVKITCKKCSAQIVVNGNDPSLFGGTAPAPAPVAAPLPPVAQPPAYPPLDEEEDDESTRVVGGNAMASLTGIVAWSVSVTDGASVQMTTQDIVRGLASGQITSDAYVWKDGMAEWALLRDVPDLARHLPGAAGSAPFAPPQPSYSGAPLGKSTVFGLGGPTPAAGSTAAFSSPGQGSVVPAAGSAAFPRHDASHAHPSATQGAGFPGYGAQAAPAGHVGERNENSVLFSLSALTNAGPAATSTRNEPQARASLDDIMNLGSPGAAGTGFGATLLAPPPSLTPQPPPVAGALGGLAASSPFGAMQPDAPPAPFAPPPGASPAFGAQGFDSRTAASPFGAAPSPFGAVPLPGAAAPPYAADPAVLHPPFGGAAPGYGAAPGAAMPPAPYGSFDNAFASGGLDAPKKKSKAPLLIGAAVVLVAALGGGAYWFTQGASYGDASKQASATAGAVSDSQNKPAEPPAAAAVVPTADSMAAPTPPAEAVAAPAVPASPGAGAAPSNPAPAGGSVLPVAGGSEASKSGGVTAAASPAAAAPPAAKAPEPPPPPPPPPAPEPAGAPFNASEAKAAMGAAANSARSCAKPDGPTGSGKVSLTFVPSGRATAVSVGGPFAGTPVGSCIAAAFRGVKISPFSGDSVPVSKTVVIN